MGVFGKVRNIARSLGKKAQHVTRSIGKALTSDTFKKVLKVAGVTAATALAAYGGYKAHKSLKERPLRERAKDLIKDSVGRGGHVAKEVVQEMVDEKFSKREQKNLADLGQLVSSVGVGSLKKVSQGVDLVKKGNKRISDAKQSVSNTLFGESKDSILSSAPQKVHAYEEKFQKMAATGGIFSKDAVAALTKANTERARLQRAINGESDAGWFGHLGGYAASLFGPSRDYDDDYDWDT